MANIGRYGGKITITSSTSPSGHKIETVSKDSNITGVTTGTTWTGYVGEYSGADDRNLSLSVKITTNPDSSYQGTASVTCGWTVTQEGTGSTPVGQSIFFSTRGEISSQSSEPRGRVRIWVNAESSEDDNALTWWPYMTSETNAEDLDINYSAGYVTISLQVGVEVAPFMSEYTVDVSCNGVTGHGQGGGSVPAFVDIQVPVSVTEGFAGYIDFTVFVRDS